MFSVDASVASVLWRKCFLLERNTQVICIDTTSYFWNLKVDHIVLLFYMQ